MSRKIYLSWVVHVSSLGQRSVENKWTHLKFAIQSSLFTQLCNQLGATIHVHILKSCAQVAQARNMSVDTFE